MNSKLVADVKSASYPLDVSMDRPGLKIVEEKLETRGIQIKYWISLVSTATSTYNIPFVWRLMLHRSISLLAHQRFPYY